jgi:CcmD family protein
MMRIFKLSGVFFLVFLSENIFAQEVREPVMAEGFYKEGKIYVVIAVFAIVLLGMIVYLFSMDRKLKKLEEQIKPKK